MDTQELLETFDITKEDYLELLNGMGGPSIISHDDDETGNCDYLYFDGDGGSLLIHTYSEMFDDEGFTIKLVAGCAWCEVPWKILREIMEREGEIY